MTFYLVPVSVCLVAPGDQSPRQALEILSSIEAQASRERADYDRLCAARVSLGVEGSDDAALRGLEEELGDLRAVWTAVLPLHDGLQVSYFTPPPPCLPSSDSATRCLGVPEPCLVLSCPV